MMPSNFTILFLNINSLSNEKLLEIQALNNSDIICLAETRQSESRLKEFSLKGYEVYYKCRSPRSLSANRVHGGVATFIKSTLMQGIKLINSSLPDVLWLKLNKDFFNLDKDIFLATIYLPPLHSHWYDNLGYDIFDELGIEILEFSQKGMILLAGDFNAKTANETGLPLPQDMDPNEPYLPTGVHEVNFYRMSKDNNPIDPFGRSLLDICNNLSLVILNGNVGTDKNIGSFTFQRKLYNGKLQQSVIDYMIASLDLLPLISEFEIIPHPANISDHFALILSLKANLVPRRPQSTPISTEANIHWHPQLENQYLIKLEQYWESHATNFRQVLEDKTLETGLKIKELTGMLLQSIKESTKRINPDSGQPKTHKKPKNPPWWNEQCQKLYKEYTKAIHKCRQKNSLTNCELRKRRHAEFTRLFRRQRNMYYRQLATKLSNLSTNRPKDFWRLLKNQKQTEVDIDPLILLNHYKNLLQPETALPVENGILEEIGKFETEGPGVEALDAEISVTECKKALKRLVNGKSPGLDRIPYEYLKTGSLILSPFLTKLFNCILQSGCYPSEWTQAIICSIYKAGDKADPENYRGISLLPSLGKLFDTILETRLRSWEKANAVLNQNQAGFRSGYATVDHIFTLNSIIQRYKSEGRKVYCAFIDFSKAFDTVNRTVLYYKLQKEGVSPKFIRLIRSLYSQTKACIKGYENEFFDILSGVQQGAPLSPLFFALILNDLDKELRKNNTGSITLQNLVIHSLLFADDLVMLSETAQGLLHSLSVLYNYSKKWGLKVNPTKSKVIIFRNPGPLTVNTIWRMGNSDLILERVDEYKYLGVWFKSTGLTQFTLKKRAELGNSAKFSLINSLRNLNLELKLNLSLFDTLVTSVLFYGVEVWGYLKTKNHIELVHTSFLRQTLKVRKSTPLLTLYGETGRIPLSCFATLRMIRYWSKLVNLPDDRYAKVAYKDALDLYHTNPDYSPWCSFILKALRQISMHGHFDFSSVPNLHNFYNTAKTRLFEKYKKEWQNEISRLSSLDNYMKFKPSHGLEHYFSVVSNKKHLTALCRFRLRSHNLAIELGRHKNMPRDRRICNYCDMDQIEDEIHFLLFCPLYEEFRRPLIPLISELNTHDAFVFLLHSTAPEVLKLVAKFIYLAFEKRSGI